MNPRTLFDKIWDAHIVVPETDAAPAVFYIDLHLLHEVTTPQAFTELATRGLSPRRVERCIATMDHSTPTLPADAERQTALRQRCVRAAGRRIARKLWQAWH
jgi:3-isopropylmalate/(R)-2-methylmalate dehydratase large subunit